ncbi:MAG: hypothetical protein U5L96_04780 [Owenweeksia sp.]|nr:hypothetical protein [Owenweeksia sp.]
MPQETVFKAGGLQINPNNYQSASGCDGEAPAAITPKAPQTKFNQALNNNVTFNWVPDCQHLTCPSRPRWRQ